MDAFAPIVLFVYNRPEHTRKTLDALSANTGAKESVLYIYCDGAKAGASPGQLENIRLVRQLAKKENRFKKVSIKERENNTGLANSVLSGVSEIVALHRKVIVLEDDLVTSPDFLHFMNTSLEKYKSSGKVACISGYVYPLKNKMKEAFFIQGADCWGWATWADKWNTLNTNSGELKSAINSQKREKEFNFNNSYPYMQMLEDKIAGKNQSWAILWYASAFVADQLCLYPPYSLVHNIGNDGSGTHTRTPTDQFAIDLKKKTDIVYPLAITESADGRKQFELFFNAAGTGIAGKIKKKIRRIYRHLFSPATRYGWFGNYASWNDAQQKCTGYDAANILEKVKTSLLNVKNGEAVSERDSVLFDEIQYSEPLSEALRVIASENNQTLFVVDFGGSLGSSYFQNKKILGNIKELRWSIVEQKHFVDCGKQYFEDEQLKFYYTIEDALQEKKAQVLLLSSVIQYVEKPYEWIEKIINYGFPYIIVDRTAFIECPKERITVQVVPEFIYKASYPSWFFNEQKFINAFSGRYRLIREFDSKFDPREPLEDGVLSYRKGFIFRKK